MAKIGLVAPFEGTDRQAGYAALATLRETLAEGVGPPVDLLPLALDGHADGARTRRSLEKMLADASVGAVVGPLSPALALSVVDLMDDSTVPWFVPYAVDPDGGFAHPTRSNQWALGLIGAVGEYAQVQGATAIRLAGSAVGWPTLTAAEWSAAAGLPVTFADRPAEIGANDVVFWLGDAATGAHFLNELRRSKPETPFWFGSRGDDPLLAQLAEEIHQVYWSVWTDLEYTAWAATRSPASPNQYLIHKATLAAVGSIMDGQMSPQLPEGSDWFVALYAISADGVPVPLVSR